MKSKFDRYKKSVRDDGGSLKDEEYWPIAPTKMMPYYDAGFLMDFYKRYQYLKSKGCTKEQIFKLFPNSSYLKCFLINFACMSLKYSEQSVELMDYFKNREDFCADILGVIDLDDPDFIQRTESRDLYSRAEFKDGKKIKTILSEKFLETNDKNEGIISRIKVAAFGLNWSIYGDLFSVFGYFVYGKAPAEYRGKKLDLFIYKFDHQRPSVVWPKTKNSPYERIDFYVLSERGKDVGVKYILTKVDGKTLKNEKEYSAMVNKVIKATMSQSAYVEGLSELQKVDKMMHLTYYAYRVFLGEDWGNMYKRARKNLKIFGDTFLKQRSMDSARMTFWQTGGWDGMKKNKHKK